MDEAVIRRKFHLFDAAKNHNKYWKVELFSNGTLRTTFSRVGARDRVSERHGKTVAYVERVIADKIKKGYVEVDLHDIGVVEVVEEEEAVYESEEVRQFLSFIFEEAGVAIEGYLATTVDAMSAKQIQAGVRWLNEAEKAYEAFKEDGSKISPLIDATEMFYKTIPTKTPPKIKIRNLALNLGANIEDFSDRLLQLEAALSVYENKRMGKTSMLDQLGIELTLLDEQDPKYINAAEIYKTGMNPAGFEIHSWEGKEPIQWIFEVTIPGERKAYEAETFGESNIQPLWHGSRAEYTQRILKSGLIVPPTAANGRRLGDGIYFAPDARRSFRYTGSSSNLRMMYLHDVKMGRDKVETGTASYKQAPDGYESVRGTGSWGGLDEIVVYKTSQQTMRYVVVARDEN